MSAVRFRLTNLETGVQGLNERVTFVVAAVAAEFATSTAYYLGAPSSPLSGASPNLLMYAIQHASLATVLWGIVVAVMWLMEGSNIVRLRQNLSSKLTILTKLALTGLLLDAAASLYQLSEASQIDNIDGTASVVLLGLAARASVYLAVFALVVFIAYRIALTRKPIVTPPPRFGRE